MALVIKDGQATFACTAREIELKAEDYDDYEDEKDNYCPICGEYLNVVFGCPFRGMADHQSALVGRVEIGGSR